MKILYKPLFFGVFFLLSCERNIEFKPLFKEMEGNIIQLNEKLENPYAIDNMQRAAASLSLGKVIPTHLYIKIEPQSFEEFEVLKNDSTLILYDYPLDYELTEGDYYRDPYLPEDIPNPQYTVIERSQPLPEHSIVLEHLHLPEEGGELENEAMRLAGHEYASDKLDDLNTRWNPSGSVQVWDDLENKFVPVEGVKVRARRWFRTKEAITDANGNYKTGSFSSSKVNYSIVWERYHYSIRAGQFGQAYYNGPKYKKKAWNVRIYNKSLQQAYCFTHIGAYRYYYKNIKGLKRPPMNSSFKPQMKLAVIDNNGFANYNKNERIFGLIAPIEIYRRVSNNIQEGSQIYEIALHELSHSSHWELRGAKFDSKFTSRKLKESWSTGVEWYLIKTRYPLWINQWQIATFQKMQNEGGGYYTALIIDLFDTQNQGLFDPEKPFDNVSGIPLQVIESQLPYCSNINDLKLRLKGLGYTGIDDIFSQYENLSR